MTTTDGFLGDLLGPKVYVEGTLIVPRRKGLSLKGSGVTIDALDDPEKECVELTFTAAGGAGASTYWKDAVVFAVTSALPAHTRVGNVLTADANGVIPDQDGVTPQAGDRMLLAVGTSVDNGLYVVTDVGSAGTPWILTRSSDADTDAEVKAGLSVLVTQGTAYHDKLFRLATDGAITLNTTPLTFSLDQNLPTPSAAGQVVVWNGSAWLAGAVDLADTDAVTGKLPIANIADGSAGTVLAGGSPNAFTATPSVTGLTATSYVNAVGDGSAATLNVYRFSADSNPAAFNGYKARGSYATPAIVQNNDLSWRANAYFYDGGAWHQAATMYFAVYDASPASGDIGASLVVNMDAGNANGSANRLVAYPESTGGFVWDFQATGSLKLGDFTGSNAPAAGLIRVPYPASGSDVAVIAARNMANSADRQILRVYSSGGYQYASLQGLDALTIDGAVQVLLNGGTANHFMLQAGSTTVYKRLDWINNLAAPGIKQSDAAASANGYTFTVQAQAAITSGYNGGPLALKGGASGGGAGINGPVELYAGATKMASFGGVSANDYIAQGTDPADSGAIRWSHGLTWNAETNTPGTDRALVSWGVVANDTLAVGDTNAATQIKGSTVDVTATSVELNGSAATMIEAVEIAAGRRVVALALGADLTTTEMPSSTGDRVVFLANCATAPTAAPSGGGIFYASSGKLYWMDSSGVSTQITP